MDDKLVKVKTGVFKIYLKATPPVTCIIISAALILKQISLIMWYIEHAEILV